MSTELSRLKRLLAKSMRDALEAELGRMGLKDHKVKVDYPDAWVRMRVPEGILEMTGSIHGFLNDAIASRSDWGLRERHIRRGGDITPNLSERDTFRAVLLSLRNSQGALDRLDPSRRHSNPYVLDALALVRACLAAQAQIRWDGGEEGLRPLRASLKATFRTYREHLGQYETDPTKRALADHCSAKIRSLVPVIKQVDEAIAATRRADRLNRKVKAELEGSAPSP